MKNTCHACSSKHLFCESNEQGRDILSDRTGKIIARTYESIEDCQEKTCGACRAILCQATPKARVECDMRKILIANNLK